MRTLAPALMLGLLTIAVAPGGLALAQTARPPSSSSVFTPQPDPTPAATPPAGAVRPVDEGLGPKQFALATLGTVATVGLGLGLNLLTDDPEGREFVGGGVLAPTVAGLVVCGVGNRWSLHYEGRCGAAVVGAYLGALGGGLSAFLLSLSTCTEGSDSCLPTVVVLSALGYLVGTSAGALIGWNISREPKAQEPSNTAPVAFARDEGERLLAVADRPAPPPPRGSAAFPHRAVVLPVLGLTF